MTPAPKLGMPEIRDTTIAELSERFANDELGMEEFERRVTLAHRADSVGMTVHTRPVGDSGWSRKRLPRARSRV